jgi:hypothetical protein
VREKLPDVMGSGRIVLRLAGMIGINRKEAQGPQKVQACAAEGVI